MTVKPGTALDFIAKSVYEVPYFGAFSIDAFLYQTLLLFLICVLPRVAVPPLHASLSLWLLLSSDWR